MEKVWAPSPAQHLHVFTSLQLSQPRPLGLTEASLRGEVDEITATGDELTLRPLPLPGGGGEGQGLGLKAPTTWLVPLVTTLSPLGTFQKSSH